MISVILYGRNDSHGYNLHKRAAISLNCIAEMLSDPDDEIIFVDYNTPNDLPTFIEAIYDTLTPKAKSWLRVFRVRPQMHAKLVPRTHLHALEPHSRNIAIRRSNPKNRWILFTNTDMVFLPRESYASFADAARDLKDGMYILPRYELPETLWESFPRTDPHEIMRLCGELSQKLHLEEITTTFPYMLFDTPGDFQLIPRQAMFDIHGFDERMIFGWHADSNLCKRLHLFYGSRTESLADRMRGYHCDHTRVATLAHRLDIKLENNLQEFVYGVEDPVAPHQAETWGAPNEDIEELDFDAGPPALFASAVAETIAAPQQIEYHSDANDLRNFVFYYPEHVLPYVAGNLTVYPRDARFAYVGNNPHMLDLIARCVSKMGFTHRLAYVPSVLMNGPISDSADAVEAEAGKLIEDYDLLIFDFGLDQAALAPLGLTPEKVVRVTDWPAEQRYSLGVVARYLETAAEASDALASTRGFTPDFLTLNANHHVFHALIRQFLIATDTPYPTHVRKGRPRIGQDRLYRWFGWKYAEDALRSFFAYGEEEHTIPVLGPGDTLDMTAAGKSAHHKDGHWGTMDFSGCWIDGYKASLVFAPPAGFADLLVVSMEINEGYLAPQGDPIRIHVFFEGEPMGTWTIYSRFEPSSCKVELPGRLLAGKNRCRLELQIENPQSVERIAKLTGQKLIGEDPRELSIRVYQIKFETEDRWNYSLGQALDFTEKGRGGQHTDECWSIPDDLGTWTLGPDATLLFRLPEVPSGRLLATFTINDVAVNEDAPYQEVAVSIEGTQLAKWSLGPYRETVERRIMIPEGMLTSRRVRIAFHIPAPKSPQTLGWSSSTARPLGFRLIGFSLAPARSTQYKLGDVIDLTDSGDAGVFIGDVVGSQWSLPEQTGVWSLGETATVKIQFEAPPTGAVPASFVISDCMVSKSSLPLIVRVKANGSPIAEWTLRDREAHRRSVDLPAALAGKPELLLTFEIDKPRSPESLGWSPDTRHLGFRLSRLAIGRADVPMPVLGEHVKIRRSIMQRIIGLPQFAVHVARILARRYLS